MASADTDQGPAADTEETKEQPKLTLNVAVKETSACERHITVSIAREDVERYFGDALEKIAPRAQVPGFRAGKAPKKLVENRFREELRDQVRGQLLMDSLTQITAEQKFAAISEPDFDLEAIEVPDEGPMTFEFDLEVRPEFDLPEWRGMRLERPVHQATDDEVKKHLTELLSKYADLTPIDDPAELGDYVTADIKVLKDGHEINHAHELEVRVMPKLSFPDGELNGFDKLMVGAKAGDEKRGKVRISPDVEDEKLRGEDVEIVFNVLDVKRLELPEMTPSFLREIGDYQNAEEVMTAARGNLERQMAYHQSQRVRQQITALLTASAGWELPPDMLRRQARREFDRAVMELRSSGFSDEAIRQHSNEIRQNTATYTTKALKEHFILERIAENEKLEVKPEDYDMEVKLMAMQTNESPRRVRARLEKKGQMDALHNQIIERKVIGLIQQHAQFHDVDFHPRKTDVEAVEFELTHQTHAHIPEAKHDEEGVVLPGQPEKLEKMMEKE